MSPQRLKPLKSVSHALDVLQDNNIDIREMTGAVRQQVFDWKRQDHFPTNTYLMFAPLFEKLGYEAPAHLWRMRTEPYSHAK